MSKSVREMVADVQKELLVGSLLPMQASKCETQLTALLGNIAEEIRDADAAFAQVLLEALDRNEAANRARIRAETTPEFKRRQEARDTHKHAMEMIRSLRSLQRVLSAEMQLQR